MPTANSEPKMPKLASAGAEIALVCGLKVRVGCQDRLCMNSHADKTLAQGCTFAAVH